MQPTDKNYTGGEPLPLSFYGMSALEVAPLLLGQTLVRHTEQGDISCRIIETESYGGVGDKGSHAFGGRRTARTEVMFHEGGLAYIYLIYGMYNCLNVVTGPSGDPQAVLIRAVEPLTDNDEMLMRMNRDIHIRKPADLSGGPGKLCRALRIDKSLNGSTLYEQGCHLWIEAGQHPDNNSSIVQAPRINIDYAEEYASKPWRFYYRDHPYVSVVDKKATAWSLPTSR
ncbi:DNA-3-methyladenine glycosylase [Paenibacillus segetis]|uniref:Putative 3-methyladenine DNA glycosylase n=1 Tax=Paenibacillus segetis TaxID=1325360 RepID=A0ABQ1YVQ1_9BACL|nr:DNA-3-methyladenine glycosylase [Paenibacillus segetis]GGH40633.1 putative 3-methyladenine DNA glycosylase [Paenibacillus segetis]